MPTLPKARLSLAIVALPLALAACDTAAPELQDLPEPDATELESAEDAFSASEDTPSEFEDATGSNVF